MVDPSSLPEIVFPNIKHAGGGGVFWPPCDALCLRVDGWRERERERKSIKKKENMRGRRIELEERGK